MNTHINAEYASCIAYLLVPDLSQRHCNWFGDTFMTDLASQHTPDLIISDDTYMQVYQSVVTTAARMVKWNLGRTSIDYSLRSLVYQHLLPLVDTPQCQAAIDASSHSANLQQAYKLYQQITDAQQKQQQLDTFMTLWSFTIHLFDATAFSRVPGVDCILRVVVLNCVQLAGLYRQVNAITTARAYSSTQANTDNLHATKSQLVKNIVSLAAHTLGVDVRSTSAVLQRIADGYEMKPVLHLNVLIGYMLSHHMDANIKSESAMNAFHIMSVLFLILPYDGVPYPHLRGTAALVDQMYILDNDAWHAADPISKLQRILRCCIYTSPLRQVYIEQISKSVVFDWMYCEVTQRQHSDTSCSLTYAVPSDAPDELQETLAQQLADVRHEPNASPLAVAAIQSVVLAWLCYGDLLRQSKFAILNVVFKHTILLAARLRFCIDQRDAILHDIHDDRFIELLQVVNCITVNVPLTQQQYFDFARQHLQLVYDQLHVPLVFVQTMGDRFAQLQADINTDNDARRV